MSAIRTWKQYDKAISAIGCETEFSVGQYGEMRTCGDERRSGVVGVTLRVNKLACERHARKMLGWEV